MLVPLFQMVLNLTNELRQAREEIASLKGELNAQRTQQPAAVTTLDNDFPALPVPASEFQSAPWHQQPPSALSFAEAAAKNREKREAVAVRFFQAPSASLCSYQGSHPPR